MTYLSQRYALSRRSLLRIAGVATAGAGLAGCVGPGSRSVDSGSGFTGPVEGNLSFAHWRAEDQKAFAKAIAEFTGDNPKVSIRQDISPSNDYQTTALQRLKGGDVGDVFTAFPGAQFHDMTRAGLFADLPGRQLTDRFLPNLITGGQRDGKQWGLPYQLVFNIPLVNVDLLERAGISEMPKDWNGFLAMCEKLRGQGLVPIAWPGADPGNAGQLIGPMVMNNAPFDDMFTRIETGAAKATDDWYLTTLEQFAQLRPYFQPNATGTAVEPAQQMFVQQKAALLATGSYHAAGVRKLGATFPVDLISPITVSADRAKYEGVHNATFILGINRASEKKAAGLAFLKHLTDPAVAGRIANATKQHVTLDGIEYTDPDLHALEPWTRRKTLLSPRYQFNDLDVRNAVENAAIQVVGGKPPQQAADEAQRIVDQKR